MQRINVGDIIVTTGFEEIGKFGDPVYGYACTSMFGQYKKSNRRRVIVKNAPKTNYPPQPVKSQAS